MKTESLAERIRRLRIENGLTIREVAEAIQVPITTYRDWEYGKAIRGEPYSKLASVFNVSLEELLLGEEKANPEILRHLMLARESIEAVIKSVKAL